ncbi:sushi, von Willebrand factor type A, EGF and pentraxin domain-containing protein 1-like [Ruditapes philippinarum]|uniref:sushi, von Willebrand factor type A, EGF and pentraxin domain-containing protein 1-like n=1 Tax=Ruditapes philippinarum TaxID=129788 RepID=UPI00295A904F|nr:sushi, von Willebrand factor type A, EGF and pentraxin domain-containing protein 1-like [Ruditapes philippinarum]
MRRWCPFVETGKWETQQCEILNCEAVPVIANGQVTLTQDGNTTFGAIANVSCSIGYNATVDTILCLDTGEWDNATCTLIDCSVAPKVSNGNVALLKEENTTYGALAEITCETGYNFSVSTIQCRDTGFWDTATCDLIVCEPSPTIENGEITLQEERNYSFGAIARIDCDTGYTAGITAIQCRRNGTWDTTICSIIDCGRPDDLMNGTINTSNGTTYGSTATYSCDEGLDIIGDVTRICDANGKWSKTKPDCLLKEVQTPKTCKENVDSRGLTWKETISGNIRNESCQSGFTGSISRTCGAGGVWNLPQYNCVRESIVKVNEKVLKLSKNSTGDEVDTVLEEILKVTTVNETTDNNNTLTDGELRVLSSSLETVADVLANSSGIINENITDEFLEIASNLVDDSNQESWKSISQSVFTLREQNENKEVKPIDNHILRAEMRLSLNTPPIDVKKVSNKGVSFPDPDKTVSDKDDANTDWFKQASSSLRLEAAALKKSCYFKYNDLLTKKIKLRLD